jgi:hypothetical protein
MGAGQTIGKQEIWKTTKMMMHRMKIRIWGRRLIAGMGSVLLSRLYMGSVEDSFVVCWSLPFGAGFHTDGWPCRAAGRLQVQRQQRELNGLRKRWASGTQGGRLCRAHFGINMNNHECIPATRLSVVLYPNRVQLLQAHGCSSLLFDPRTCHVKFWGIFQHFYEWVL